VFGTHRENVAIQTDGLTARGVGAVILPLATPAVHACFDPTAVAEAVHGICVIGDVDFVTGEVSRHVEDVTVQGFTIRDFVGSGIAAVAARDTSVEGNVLRDNTDAGINVSTSRDTQIRGNRISGSRFGITLAAASGGAIVANSMRKNCVGAALLGPVDAFRLVANDISRNRNACPPNADVPAASGIGIVLVGAARQRHRRQPDHRQRADRRHRVQRRRGVGRGRGRQSREGQRDPAQRPRPALG
jgi:parallel beta-helix repeat protein